MVSIPRFLSLCNVVLAFAQAIASVFFFRGPSGGGALAEAIAVPTALQPAPFSFAIWGAIYLGSMAYAFWYATQGRWAHPDYPAIGALSALGFSASILWQIVAMSGPVWATLPAIILMLGSILGAFALSVRSPARGIRSHDHFVVFPLGIYAAWLIAATGVNLAEVLDEAGQPLGPGGLLAALAIVSLTAILIARWARSVGFIGGAVWALVGVAAAGLSRGSPDTLALAAIAAAVLLLAAALPGAIARLGSRMT